MNNTLLIGVLVALVVVALTSRRRRGRLPPGPKGVPFFGNVFDLPKEGVEWLKYVQWGQQYGM